jgi:hypothetical protein
MGGDLCVVDRSFELLVMYPAYELFAEGLTHKPGQGYVSFATMVQRRYIAIQQCAAVAIGVPALFSEKKLHAFRVQCTNVLGSTGASEAERECHIGWQSTVQSRHYVSLKHNRRRQGARSHLRARRGHDQARARRAAAARCPCALLAHVGRRRRT